MGALGMPTEREVEAARALERLALQDPFCVKETVVPEDYAAGHLAERGVLVLSTPCMLLLVEQALRECLDRELGGGLTTVGVRADVRHHRPAPVGSRVRVEGWLLSVRGARVLLYARVLGESGLVGEVVHERAVVEAGRLA
jgi:fluoroacetyl-CoA thioesterase